MYSAIMGTPISTAAPTLGLYDEQGYLVRMIIEKYRIRRRALRVEVTVRRQGRNDTFPLADE